MPSDLTTQPSERSTELDDLILELAVAASCRYIVSHNIRDFQGVERWGIEAVTPGRFLHLVDPSSQPPLPPSS